MSVMTVTGPVDKDSLGITLAHEHLFLDVRNQFTGFDDPQKARISRQDVGPGNIDVLRRNPYAIKDNLVINDLQTAIEEVGRFKKCGGQTIVECTSLGLKRDPLKLKELSLRSGVTIIAGCGYYTRDTHPPEMEKWSPEEIADGMITELTECIGDTGIRAGVIGEIGTSDPIHPNEKKNLVAAALAFRQTGAAIYIHTYPWGRCGLECAQVLIEHKVDPAKIVICHTDVAPNLEYIWTLLELGVFVEFDDFGKEYPVRRGEKSFAGGPFAPDSLRIRIVRELVCAGYVNQLLVTNDICFKSMLHTFGGKGYDNILTNIVPSMLSEEIGQDTIDKILNENPASLLDT